MPDHPTTTDRKGWKCPGCGDLDGNHIKGCRFSPPYDTDEDIRRYYQAHSLPTHHPSRHQWCRYAGPGRGDCEHFVGIPAVLDDTTTDEYGIPHGWCDYCWVSLRLRACEERIIELEDEAIRVMQASEGAYDA